MTGAVAAAQYSVAAVVVVTVQLHNQTVTAVAVNATATPTYITNSDGNAYSDSHLLEAWLTGTGANSSNYEIMATQSSGAAVSGDVLGTWLNCGTTRAWFVSNGASNNSVLTGVIAVQIRDVATHTVQAAASITLSAESDGSSGH